MKGKEWQEMFLPSGVMRMPKVTAATLTEPTWSLGEELEAQGKNNAGDYSSSWTGLLLQIDKLQKEGRVMRPATDIYIVDLPS